MLDILSKYDIHSIEQPIRQNQWNEMSRLCASTPIPIALDEELIGVNIYKMKKEVLDTIKPQYIVLKPSLHGGITGTLDWIQLQKKGILAVGLPVLWKAVLDLQQLPNLHLMPMETR